MDQDSFRMQIAEQLQNLSDDSIRTFAWLCGVRALPLLGASGNFSFWEKQDNSKSIQINLYSILRALDIAAIGESGITFHEAFSASRDAIPELTATYAASAAANAAEVVLAIFQHNHTNAVNAAASAAYYADSSFLSSGLSYDFKTTILHDLMVIANDRNDYFNDTLVYGDVWINFQRLMQEYNCEYWLNWYEHLFEKGFRLSDADFMEINTRLHLPGNPSSYGAAEIARHLIELDKLGSEHFNEIRILILGEKGAGKTSLALRLKQPTHPMPSEEDSTEGVDIIDWQFDVSEDSFGTKIIVHIWDFAGHVITHAVHRCFMSERCLYILVVNGRTEGNHRIEYWLDQIHNYGGESPVIIFINTQDNHKVDIQENTLKKAFPSIISIKQINIGFENADFNEFRQSVMQYLVNSPFWRNQKVSTPTYKIKEALRKRFIADGCEYIQRDEFDVIASDAGVLPEEIKNLLEDLRDLGICLWYDDDNMKQYSTMVLNPGWISHGIYRLINWGLNERKHVLSNSDFSYIFTDIDKERYPKEKADFLFCLMRKYQLAFFKDETRIFIPLLLPADRPNDDLLPNFEFGERLHMEYHADRSIPEYTVSRLSVIHSDELIEEKSWRYGAVLRWNETDAIVIEHDLSRSVSVSVKGPYQKEYITRLRNTLDSIFDEYKCNRPELNIEILIPDELFSQTSDHLILPTEKNCFLHPIDQIIANASMGQRLYTGSTYLPWIDLMKTMQGYGLVVMGDLVLGGVVNKNTKVDIRFSDCTIKLQEELNYLADRFRTTGDEETAIELNQLADVVDTIDNSVPENAEPYSQELESAVSSLRKKGLLRHLENLYEELSNEDSDLNKKIKKLKNGVATIQKLGSYYNNVAQWVGLPQIPTPLLGKKKE